MVGHQLPARPAAGAGLAEGGVRKERRRPRRSRKRVGDGDGDASTERSPRAAKPASDAATVSSEPSAEKEIEEGSVDDTGAEYIEHLYAYVGSAEKEAQLTERLLKKRANMRVGSVPQEPSR